MSHEALQQLIWSDFREQKPNDKESAMVIVRERLKHYPRELQQFGEWFDKHSEMVLTRCREH